MTEIRGKDDIEGIRYDPKTGDVLTRCSSCNIYRKRGDFVSSLFRLCSKCQREAGQLQETRASPDNVTNVGIRDYVGPGKRRNIERVIWKALKPIAAPTPGPNTQYDNIGRPSTSAVKAQVLKHFFSNQSVQKKYRKALMHVLANNALPPAQMVWLALKNSLLTDSLLRLWSVDNAREIVGLSDLQDITDVSYFYDDAENIARNPTGPKAQAEAQKDLRNRVGQVAKVLADPKLKASVKVFPETWEAYDALLSAIHPGALRAAETTCFYFVKSHVREFDWHPERALRKLTQLLAERIESISGVASDETKRALRRHTEPSEPSQPETSRPGAIYWVSCNAIYPDDRYLIQVDQDEENVTMVVFHNPSNLLEVGRKFQVPKRLLEPGPDGYFEIPEEDLTSQGVELP